MEKGQFFFTKSMFLKDSKNNTKQFISNSMHAGAKSIFHEKVLDMSSYTCIDLAVSIALRSCVIVWMCAIDTLLVAQMILST